MNPQELRNLLNEMANSTKMEVAQMGWAVKLYADHVPDGELIHRVDAVVHAYMDVLSNLQQDLTEEPDLQEILCLN